MLIDANSLERPTVLASQICIIGGGAAGLILANELGAAGCQVIVVESGGLQTARATSRLITGSAVNTPGLELGGVRRRLGGSMSDWGANCALIDERHLEIAAAHSDAAWPDAFVKLNSFAMRAGVYLSGLEGFSNRGLDDTLQHRPSPYQNSENICTGSARFQEKLFVRGSGQAADRIAEPLTDPGSQVRVLLHATAMYLDHDGATASELKFANGRLERCRVKAQVFVIAAGTENAPLLMRSLGPDTGDARNKLPALGRLLHAHLLSVHGFVLPGRDDTFLHRYALPASLLAAGRDKSSFHGLMPPGPDSANKSELASVLFFEPVLHGSRQVGSEVIARAKRLHSIPIWKHRLLQSSGNRWLTDIASPTMYAVRHYMEQPARWESGVSLGSASGPLGLPKALFKWQIGEEECQGILDNCSRLARFLETNDLGEVVGYQTIDNRSSPDFCRNVHPMGGTVTGSHSKNSVVDEDLRVHGIHNLYVCGGSVIPRSGVCMTTTVIAQLAVRLADHLKKVIGVA